MLEEILKENRDSCTDKGLKYSVLEHYINGHKSIPNKGVYTLKDNKTYLFFEGEKPQNDINIMQNLLHKNLGFTVPKILPVDLENGKGGVILSDLANPGCTATEKVLKRNGDNLKLNDLYLNFLSAYDFHNYQNEKHILPLLKDDFMVTPFLSEKYFILKQIVKNRRLKPGNRPVDKIFADEFSDFAGFFDDNALIDLLKSRLIKISTFDTKDNLNSHVYKINGSGIVEKVIPTFSCVANQDVEKLRFNDEIFKNKYESEFYFGSKNLNKAVKLIRENEQINKIFTQSDRLKFTKELWNASSENLANEYKENVGYDIDKIYAKSVESNKSIVGEIFRQGNECVPFVYNGDY